MIYNPVYIQAVKYLAFMTISVALSRFGSGAWLGVIILMSCMWGASGKTGKAFAMYLMLMSMVAINPVILPKGAMFGYCVRFGPLSIGLLLMLRGFSLSSQTRVPFGFLVVYLLWAAISSMGGWAPLISYLKLVNFLVFLLGLWFGLNTLAKDADGMVQLRAMLLAFAMFIILGSAILLPFPGISTLSGFQLALREGNVGAANAALAEAMANPDLMSPLFCGITNQSQAFAPLTGMLVFWVLADMLFVENRFSKLHLSLIAIAIPLIFLSRSRVGLVTLVAGIGMVAWYLPKKIVLPWKIKQKLKSGIAIALAMVFVVAIISEIRNKSMTKWLRKTNDLASDTRSLSDAVTASRQGLVDESMDDFRRNPIFGSGFQVSEQIADMVAKSGSGLVLSAPIEKGILPIMVLGETGIVGEILFVIFLVSFYTGTATKQLYVTMALFTIMLATNLGEASFFSPGGLGGVLWAIAVIGGYCLDRCILQKRRMLVSY